jgi:hypothetical protein
MRAAAAALKRDPSLLEDADQTDGYRLRIVQDG